MPLNFKAILIRMSFELRRETFTVVYSVNEEIASFSHAKAFSNISRRFNSVHGDHSNL
jgi:hypothetical protein